MFHNRDGGNHFAPEKRVCRVGWETNCTLCPGVIGSEMTLIPWRDFSPAVRRAVRIDVSVTLLFAVCSGLTVPFTGLILRRELGASPFQLSVLGSANAACLLLSLALARVVDSR